MIEAAVAAAIAAVPGLGVAWGRVNTRITDMDNRLDRMEVRIAERYVQRQELFAVLEKVEDHMIRIENKIDKIVLGNRA